MATLFTQCNKRSPSASDRMCRCGAAITFHGNSASIRASACGVTTLPSAIPISDARVVHNHDALVFSAWRSARVDDGDWRLRLLPAGHVQEFVTPVRSAQFHRRPDAVHHPAELNYHGIVLLAGALRHCHHSTTSEPCAIRCQAMARVSPGSKCRFTGRQFTKPGSVP